ncbi:anti sigma factor C-terminal domain-containing protein [Cytobacillus suaedae]|nr:anti sigma factor C-terminal domain-containing protein [Cytobacillus suaedae]
MTEWTKEKEKKVLWKYRFVLTTRIVRVLFIILFLFWVYMMFITIAYQGTNFANKHSFYTKLSLDWTGEGLESEFSGFVNGEITPMLSQKIEYPVFRRIGKESIPVGEMKITKRVLTPFSQRNLEYFVPNESSRFNFYLPIDPRTGETLYQKRHSTVWDALAKVHEGTVADMSFSTTRFMEPKELMHLLEPFDLDVVWMPLYAGEMKEFESGHSIAGGSFLSVAGIGLASARGTDEDYNSEFYSRLGESTIESNQEWMMLNMEKLINEESKSYREDFLGLYHLEERYDYIKEHGFKVYGAVVTGPVKELLKLRDVKEFQSPSLGDFEYWNWVPGEE